MTQSTGIYQKPFKRKLEDLICPCGLTYAVCTICTTGDFDSSSSESFLTEGGDYSESEYQELLTEKKDIYDTPFPKVVASDYRFRCAEHNLVYRNNPKFARLITKRGGISVKYGKISWRIFTPFEYTSSSYSLRFESSIRTFITSLAYLSDRRVARLEDPMGRRLVSSFLRQILYTFNPYTFEMNGGWVFYRPQEGYPYSSFRGWNLLWVRIQRFIREAKFEKSMPA